MTSLPAPADFVRKMMPALRQAAAIARALEGRVRNRPKHGEASAVKSALTLADTAAQEALLVPLLEYFPQVRLEAEEDTPTVARFPDESDALVVVDPIDGTLRSYLEGEGPYAVMIGLALRGRYRAALVALPREGLFFSATAGGGAQMESPHSDPRPVKAEPEGERILVSHGLPEPVVEHLRSAGYEFSFACGGAVSVAPLLPGVRAGLRVAPRSPLGVSIRGRIGALIAAEAGAVLRCETGSSFPDSVDAPARALLVSANSEDLAPLERAIAGFDFDSA